MKYVFLIGVIVLFIMFPSFFTFFVFNIHNIIIWGIRDIYLYFKHKEYNRCHEFGMIRLNCATDNQVFGCGKTLMLVKRAISVYNKYNNKLVWDSDQEKFVVQKIHIISNVELNIAPLSSKR